MGTMIMDWIFLPDIFLLYKFFWQPIKVVKVEWFDSQYLPSTHSPYASPATAL